MLTKYIVQTTKAYITVFATDETQAKEQVCNAELCPMSAIIEVRNPKFTNKDGSLTAYSFACGYIQRCWVTNPELEQIEIDLYKDGCYHVRAYDLTNKFRLVWNSFDTLTEARDNLALVKRNTKSGFIDKRAIEGLEADPKVGKINR